MRGARDLADDRKFLGRSMYTERLFNRDIVNEFTDVASAARRLLALNNAHALAGLLVTPSGLLDQHAGPV
jgi:hypothetical protein